MAADRLVEGDAMTRKLCPYLALALLPAVAAIAFACGGDGEGDGGGQATAEPTATAQAGGGESDVEDALRTLGQTKPEDVDYFLGHVTDNFLANVVGLTRQECRERAQECVGAGGKVEDFRNTEVKGDRATTEAAFIFETDRQEFEAHLVRENGAWKLEDLRAVPKEIPAGVQTVRLDLNEFSFAFDKDRVKGGDFAFEVHNVGGQRHEVRMAKIPADLDLAVAVQSVSQPAGVEGIAYQGPFAPGDAGSVVFDQPLAPGRYALLCFLPDKGDPEKTAHAEKGMYADFTVE